MCGIHFLNVEKLQEHYDEVHFDDNESIEAVGYDKPVVDKSPAVPDTITCFGCGNQSSFQDFACESCRNLLRIHTKEKDFYLGQEIYFYR